MVSRRQHEDGGTGRARRRVDGPLRSAVAQDVAALCRVADAMAALPKFESLKFPTRGGNAGRKARSSSPAPKEGDDDPDQERWRDLPWDEGVWEDETDGRLGANFDENYVRGRKVIGAILKLRVVRAARGGRSFDGAIKNKFRQCVKGPIGFKFKSVEDRSENDRTFREQMIRNC